MKWNECILASLVTFDVADAPEVQVCCMMKYVKLLACVCVCNKKTLPRLVGVQVQHSSQNFAVHMSKEFKEECIL